MPKLPMHPLLFLLLYAGVGLFLPGLIFLLTNNSEISGASVNFVGVVHVYWTFAAARCASRLAGSWHNFRKAMRCLVVTLVVLGVVVSHELWWGTFIAPSVDQPLAAALNVIGGACAILVFAIFWFAASSVCEADVEPKSFGWTFLAFIYLPFGAFFIYPRLKRACQASAEPNLLRDLGAREGQ
jgi:hypothetical protein